MVNEIVEALNGARELIKALKKIVREFNEAKTATITSGYSYSIKTTKDFVPYGLPNNYPQDLIVGENEITTISIKDNAAVLLSMAGLPTSITISSNLSRNYLLDKVGDLILINGYSEKETMSIPILMIPNIHYIANNVYGEVAIPYHIYVISSPEVLISVADDVFVYKLIADIFETNADEVIATALFFTSHILGNSVLKKALKKLGVKNENIEKIIVAKIKMQSELDDAPSMVKNIFNIIASYGMVDWSIYSYIAFVAGSEVSDSVEAANLERMSKYIADVRSKMQIFLGGIKVINVSIDAKQTITIKTPEGIGVYVTAIEKIEPPF